jgi:hypothetical protein
MGLEAISRAITSNFEKFSPLRARDVLGDEEIGSNYWDE